jgi:hypothetical protein
MINRRLICFNISSLNQLLKIGIVRLIERYIAGNEESQYFIENIIIDIVRYCTIAELIHRFL